MNEQPETPKTSFAEHFVKKLSELPRAERAILKRNAGRTIAESRQAISTFYRLYPHADGDRHDEEVFFLVATLYGLNQRAHGGDFGATMKALLAKGVSEQSVDARMRVLLESGFDLIDGLRPGGGEMAYRLMQCVKLAASHEVGVDWSKLIEDLQWWTHPARRVQKNWARSYFSQTAPVS